MGKTATFESDLLRLIFYGFSTSVALAINATASPIANLFVALHTADPTVTAGSGSLGTQNASETTYGGYTRMSLARSSVGFNVTSNVASPATNVIFPIVASGSGTITHWSLGTSVSGASYMLYSGALTPNVALVIGTSPVMTSASTMTEV